MLTAVGGYSLLLAWQTSGARRVVGPEVAEPQAEPASSRPLPRVLPTIDAAGNPDGSLGRGRGIVVTLTGPTPLGRPLGIAILDGRDGRPLGFRAVEPDEFPGDVEMTGIPPGQHLVCLVRTADRARHGYLERVPIEVSPTQGPPAGRATLSARVQDIRIQLIDADDHERTRLVAHTLHGLTRVDDDEWRPLSGLPSSATETPMLMTDADGLLHLRDLGPGSYVLVLSELVVDGGSSRFTFRVPGPENLDIICRSR